MALIHVLNGLSWGYVKAYRKDNKWYRCDNNEIINPDNIYWVGN